MGSGLTNAYSSINGASQCDICYSVLDPFVPPELFWRFAEGWFSLFVSVLPMADLLLPFGLALAARPGRDIPASIKAGLMCRISSFAVVLPSVVFRLKARDAWAKLLLVASFVLCLERNLRVRTSAVRTASVSPVHKSHWIYSGSSTSTAEAGDVRFTALPLGCWVTTDSIKR